MMCIVIAESKNEKKKDEWSETKQEECWEKYKWRTEEENLWKEKYKEINRIGQLR